MGYNDESDIKVLKLAEIALYNYVNYNLMFTMYGQSTIKVLKKLG
jgi:hypothetical protein